jgi:hypothetical protein
MTCESGVFGDLSAGAKDGSRDLAPAVRRIDTSRHCHRGGIVMTVYLSRMVAILTLALTLPATAAEAAGSRAGATRAAKRQVIAYVERYGTVRGAGGQGSAL